MNFQDEFGLSASERKTDQQLNSEFSLQLQSLVGTKYEYGGKDKNGIDCAGTITFALQNMGYTVPSDITSKQMASGAVDWISISPSVDKSKIGNEGTINFYKLNNSISVNHVDAGIGTPGGAPIKQIVDATEGSTLNQRTGRTGQVTEPKTGQVNQTYAPLSTNPKSQPVTQGTLNWSVLEKDYKK